MLRAIRACLYFHFFAGVSPPLMWSSQGDSIEICLMIRYDGALTIWRELVGVQRSFVPVGNEITVRLFEISSTLPIPQDASQLPQGDPVVRPQTYGVTVCRCCGTGNTPNQWQECDNIKDLMVAHRGSTDLGPSAM